MAKKKGKKKDKVKELIAQLKDKDEEVRSSAAEALSKMGDKRARVKGLIFQLKEGDEGVAWLAAEELYQIPAPAIPALIEALKDEAVGFRDAAAWALGEIGDKKAVPALRETLNDEDERVRRNAALALASISKGSFDRSAVQGAFESCNCKRVVPVLIKALKNKDEDLPCGELGGLQPAAAYALGEIKDKSAVPALIKALKAGRLAPIKGKVNLEVWGEEGIGLSGEAACALGKIGDKSAVPALIKALKDAVFYLYGEDVGINIRYLAAEALGRIGDKRAVRDLLFALEDENKDVRKAAKEALKKIKSKKKK